MTKWFILFLLVGTQLLPARTEQSNVGKTLPSLSVNYVSNAPSATTGKPMIVEFWATWCGPCRQSIPHMNEIYQKYKDRGLVVIGISNEEKDTVLNFMKSLPMNYSVALDPGSRFSGQFNVTGIPHALLVNSAGKIVWEGHPMSLETSEIDKLVASYVPSPVAPTPVQPPPIPGNKKYY